MKVALLAACLLATTLAFTSGCSSGTRSGSSMGFAADAPPAEGAAVFLRAHPSDPTAPNLVVVDVVARGAADLHGAAFRVTWDTEALAFIDAKSGSPWSKQVLAVAKEGSPGQLAVAWTERGEKGIDASAETVIGTLTFDIHGRKGTSVAFKTERSQLVDKKGAPVAVKWVGGNITAR
jgi:hypothetical protein